MKNPDTEAQFASVVSAVGLVLKPLGFKKRGTDFRLCPDNCGIISFQRSRDNVGSTVKFTLSIGIVCRRLFDDWRSPIEKASVWDAHVRERIGAFLPSPQDKWWTLDLNTDSETVTAEIVALVQTAALPFLLSHLDDHAVIALWEAGRSPGLTEKRMVEHLITLKA